MGPTPEPEAVRRLRPQVPARADNCSILASFQQTSNGSKPLREDRLMSILCWLVVAGTFKVVGKILLGGYMMRMVVSVEVTLAVPQPPSPPP